MKNPLHDFIEQYGSGRLTLFVAATLEFCFDHVNDDEETGQHETLQVSSCTDLQTAGITETV